jgi:cell pole-organizing protein PopZ
MAMESEDEDDDLKTFAFGLDDDLEVAVEPPVIAPPVDVQDALVSSVAQAAAASAFDRLAQTVAMPEQGRTIEDVVQELLRPLLKAWLDENLLPIVQAKVEEEVERIARRRF